MCQLAGLGRSAHPVLGARRLEQGRDATLAGDLANDLVLVAGAEVRDRDVGKQQHRLDLVVLEQVVAILLLCVRVLALLRLDCAVQCILRALGCISKHRYSSTCPTCIVTHPDAYKCMCSRAPRMSHCITFTAYCSASQRIAAHAERRARWPPWLAAGIRKVVSAESSAR